MSNEKHNRARGPMGPGGHMVPGEKAKDFKGTMKKLIGYMGRYKFRFLIMMVFAIARDRKSVV